MINNKNNSSTSSPTTRMQSSDELTDFRFKLDAVVGPPDKKLNHVFSGVVFDTIHYASCSIRGYRPSLEDEILINSTSSTLCFAVFDGHAGIGCAKFLRENWNQATRQSDLTKDDSICEMFLRLDAEFERRQNERFKDGIPSDLDCGSTACSLYLSRLDNNTVNLLCCNAGDSRCIYYNGESVEPLSYDHKPDNHSEKMRIESAGGWVQNKRVQGNLAVSRCFGDYMYKQSRDRTQSMVIAVPEIIRTNIALNTGKASIRFAVIACDGLYDVMDNETVAQYVFARLNQQQSMMKLPDPLTIVKDLVSRAIRLGSSDNISVIILVFR